MWAYFWSGKLTAYNLIVGGLLAVLLLSVLRGRRRVVCPSFGGVRALPGGVFSGSCYWQTSLIALLALRRRPVFYPHIIAVPLRLHSDAAISLLSATITLLPGTVAMGVSADRKLLYAHAINIKDIDEARESVDADGNTHFRVYEVRKEF